MFHAGPIAEKYLAILFETLSERENWRQKIPLEEFIDFGRMYGGFFSILSCGKKVSTYINEL